MFDCQLLGLTVLDIGRLREVETGCGVSLPVSQFQPTEGDRGPGSRRRQLEPWPCPDSCARFSLCYRTAAPGVSDQRVRPFSRTTLALGLPSMAAAMRRPMLSLAAFTGSWSRCA